MTSLDKIEQLVLQLNNTWFESKKDWFMNETFYSKKYERIFAEWEEDKWVWDYETNSLIELPPDKHGVDKSLKDYCWHGYYPEGLYAYEEEIGVLPNDACKIANKIFSEIAIMLKGIFEVKIKHIIILTSIDTINYSLEELQPANSSDEYMEFLTFFLFKTKQKISKEYGHLKRAYDISEPFKERLCFDLNQEELAALLYLLYQAGFLHTPTPTDTTFLNFCTNYFYFKNQKKKEHTASAKLRDKFNDVKNGKSIKAPKEITHRLKAAFKL